MLTSDQLRIVLDSADYRRSYGLELPDVSLRTLNNDPSQFAAFYDRWTAQGQPRYVPPVAAAAAPVAPVAAVAQAAIPMPAPVPPAPMQFAPPALPAPPAGQLASVALPNAVPSYGPPPVPNPYNSAVPFNSAMPSSSAMPYSPNMHNYVATPTGSRPGFSAMLVGFGIAAAGIIITLVTWEFSAPGGTFVVAWGAILFGSIRGIRGAMLFSRSR